MPDLTFDAFHRLLAPKPHQIFQEIEQRDQLKAIAAQELGIGVGVLPDRVRGGDAAQSDELGVGIGIGSGNAPG